jgi:Zn-dependent protease
MPFKCNYCGGYFCEQHRLPEFHDCKGTYQAGKPVFTQGAYTASGGNYNYSSARVFRPFLFSRQELRDLAVGLGVIVLIPLFRVWSFFLDEPAFISAYLLILALAFILHEFAHKFAAQHYGYWAEFRLSTTGLILTAMSFLLLQTSALPLMIVAPGAVMISGRLDLKESGRVSLAGPASNIAQGTVYILLFWLTQNSLVEYLALTGVAINAGLALFNLIPFGVFDGEKIMRWDRNAWILAAVLAGALFVVPTYLYPIF